MYYPRECYCIREDATKESKKAYAAWQNRVQAEIDRRYPNRKDYMAIPLRERLEIRKEIEMYVR